VYSLFLDANVLFSSAYEPDASLRRFWSLPDVRILSSAYAVEEARRNLSTVEHRARLQELLTDVRVSMHASMERRAIEGVQLPEKYWPILLAAIDAGATHLLTGDVRHFGNLYQERVEGVLVLRPAAYLRSTAVDAAPNAGG